MELNRARREQRIRESFDRIQASVITSDSHKFAARHPTRVVPDIPGGEFYIYFCFDWR